MMSQYQLYQQAKAELAAARKQDEPAKIEIDEVHKIVAGALYDFGAWLTIQPQDLIIGMLQDSTPLLEALAKFCEKRMLETEDARILFWQDIIRK
jgi:hypothetical protein